MIYAGVHSGEASFGRFWAPFCLRDVFWMMTELDSFFSCYYLDWMVHEVLDPIPHHAHWRLLSEIYSVDYSSNTKVVFKYTWCSKLMILRWYFWIAHEKLTQRFRLCTLRKSNQIMEKQAWCCQLQEMQTYFNTSHDIKPTTRIKNSVLELANPLVWNCIICPLFACLVFLVFVTLPIWLGNKLE